MKRCRPPATKPPAALRGTPDRGRGSPATSRRLVPASPPIQRTRGVASRTARQRVHHDVAGRRRRASSGCRRWEPGAPRWYPRRRSRVRNRSWAKARAPAAQRDPAHAPPAQAAVRRAMDARAGGREDALWVARSRVSVKTAESSIIPSCSGVQVLPASEVFHGRCQVPTEITRGDRHRFHVAELAPRQPTRFRLQDPSSQTSRAGEERFYRASTARGREPCPWRCAGKPPGARASAGPSTYRSESALELVCVARWKESSLTVSVRSICVKVRVIES